MSKPRRPLSEVEKNLLWARSGNMCAFKGCRQPLILDNIQGKLVNLADKAHVIAHSLEGPRGQERDRYGLDDDNIDSIENLILLCKIHHKLVDDRPDMYPADVLFAMKKSHEERIRRLAHVKESIALVHKTKGPALDHISIANQLDLKIVDLVSFQERLDNIAQIDWAEVKAKNEAVYEEIIKSRQNYTGAEINIFALSQIPLLIHLGYLITDTIPVRVFQYSRDLGEWVLDAPEDVIIDDMGLQSHFTTRNSNELLVSLAITSAICLEDIRDVVPLDNHDLLEVTVQKPEIDRVLYRQQVDIVKSCFKDKIEKLIQERRYKEIHLFYAGPGGLAIELGRSINESMWPSVNLYHYNYRQEPRYQKAFSI